MMELIPVKRTVLTPALITLTLLCLSLFTASNAFAQDSAEKLLDYAPEKSGAVVGMNIGAAQSTTFFKEMMKTARMSPDTKKVLSDIEKEIGLKVDRDIHALVVALPTLTNKGTDDFTMAISGKFDVEKLKADLTGQKGVTERKVGKHTVYLDDDLEVSIISDKLIFLTGGSKSYRDASVQMLTGKSASVKKGGKMKSLLKQVKTDKHMWIVADSSRVKPQKGAPGVNETYFTFDFSSGLTLDGAMKMKSEKDATMVEDEIKKNFDQGLAFANLIGAASAFNNLKVTRKGSNLSIKTAMPDKEVSAVGVWLRNMIKSAEEEQARQRKLYEQRMKEMKEPETKAQEAPAPK
jgi:hypothetical protein